MLDIDINAVGPYALTSRYCHGIDAGRVRVRVRVRGGECPLDNGSMNG